MNGIHAVIRTIGLLLILALSVSGCAMDMAATHRATIEDHYSFNTHLMAQPSTPAWDAQRKQIAQALGDKVFDKEFDRVFNSLVTALASMGATVGNMERQSGFTSASGEILPNDRAKELVP